MLPRIHMTPFDLIAFIPQQMTLMNQISKLQKNKLKIKAIDSVAICLQNIVVGTLSLIFYYFLSRLQKMLQRFAANLSIETMLCSYCSASDNTKCRLVLSCTSVVYVIFIDTSLRAPAPAQRKFSTPQETTYTSCLRTFE